MKKTIPCLRVNEEMIAMMQQAIKKHNEHALSKLSIQQFRRTALELLTQAILQDRKDILSIIDVTD